MNKTLVYLALFFIGITLASCERKCTGYQTGTIRFIGFDSASLEQMIFKKYSVGNGFDSPIDSISQFLSNGKGSLYHYDTVNKFVDYVDFVDYWPNSSGHQVFSLIPGYEYEIRIPNAGKIYRIKDLAIADAKSTCGGMSGAGSCQCTNALESYTLNDQKVSTGMSGAVYNNPSTPDIPLHR